MTFSYPLKDWRPRKPYLVRCHIPIRDLKIRRRKRERRKNNRFNQQNNNFARASRFFVHFLAVTARLRRENA